MSLMFITLQRKLPDGLVECLINTDHVVWVQADPEVRVSTQTMLYMVAGDTIKTPESYPRVMEKLVRR
jgi:hypothetical protein